MRLYVDDMRHPPLDKHQIDGLTPWTVVRTAEEAMRLLSGFDYELVSLDHDLGSPLHNGYHVLCYIENRMMNEPHWCPPYVFVHSANPAVRTKMEQCAKLVNDVRFEYLNLSDS
jgi:hypothetical protein